MKWQDALNSVVNRQIEFVTVRPQDSEFSTLQRQVVVTGPPEALQLMTAADPQVLQELVNLLKDRDRAWAAVVLLAALTRKEEKTVDAFQGRPSEWWDSIGETAYERWNKWLSEVRDRLVWDEANRVFTEKG